MKHFTQHEFDSIPRDEHGVKRCPAGDYSAISIFSAYCDFGVGSTFAAHSEFHEGCSFDNSCVFAEQCKFHAECSFRAKCVFREGCHFIEWCSFGERCIFGKRCRFGQRCTIKKHSFLDEWCVLAFNCSIEAPHMSSFGVTFESPPRKKNKPTNKAITHLPRKGDVVSLSPRYRPESTNKHDWVVSVAPWRGDFNLIYVGIKGLDKPVLLSDITLICRR